MSQSNVRSRENSAFKLKGAGDGYKPVATAKPEKTPSRRPLARDMTALQLRLKPHSVEDNSVRKLTKSKSVAEITPTKNHNRRRLRDSAKCSPLHATPRPIVTAEESANEPPADDLVVRHRHVSEMVARRLLVTCWRRQRAKMAALGEALRRRQEHVANLEHQVDCLKDLTQSECAKRTETLNAYNVLRSDMETLEQTNELLETIRTSLQIAVNNLEGRIAELSGELKNARNEIETKIYRIDRLEIELDTQTTLLRKTLQEHQELMEEKDAVIKEQNVQLETLTHELEHGQDELRRAAGELDAVTVRHDAQMELNTKLQDEVDRINCSQNKLLLEMEELYVKCERAEKKCALFADKCHGLERTLAEKEEKKRHLWENVKEAVAVTWSLLQNAAYIMLPAL